MRSLNLDQLRTMAAAERVVDRDVRTLRDDSPPPRLREVPYSTSPPPLARPPRAVHAARLPM